MSQASQSELMSQLSKLQASRASLEADNAKLKHDLSEFRGLAETSSKEREAENVKLRGLLERTHALHKDKIAEMKSDLATVET